MSIDELILVKIEELIQKAGAGHDRDINAAKNILPEGLRQIA